MKNTCLGQAPKLIPWTDEEKTRLHKMIVDGKRPCQAQHAFPGRTPGAVITMFKKMALLERLVLAPKRKVDRILPMLDPDDEGATDNYYTDWKKQARLSNKAFVAALAKVGYPA